ncbi:MAG TPA: hypothetical protein VGZ71_09040 [Puia sp.]|jgi:hypothetical protein|nr:hypothetical protein [Puia sp.]
MKPRVFLGLFLLAVVATALLILFCSNRAARPANSLGSDDKDYKAGQTQSEFIISDYFSRNLLG